jgi:murein DD-endopeptidase MepM/ murein hydrolase activator NlpD
MSSSQKKSVKKKATSRQVTAKSRPQAQRKTVAFTQCCAPEEAAMIAPRGIRIKKITARARRKEVGQSCGTHDPTAGTMTYSFSGVTYRSPDQHSNPSVLVNKARPNQPTYFPFADSGVQVWQGWIYGSGGFHSSIDYGKSQKTFTVNAVAPGKVVHVDWHPWHGNVVIVEHTAEGYEPFRSMYFHLRNGKTHDLNMAKQTNPDNYSGDSNTKAKRYKAYADQEYGGETHWGTNSQKILVKTDEWVNLGQQLAWAGNTGIGGASAMLNDEGKPNSSGQTNIHLHFMIAVHDAGKWYFVDPYGAYSKSLACYKERGAGQDAKFFLPHWPHFHNWDSDMLAKHQEGFDYYAQFGYGPTDLCFHWAGSQLRMSGIYERYNEKFAVRTGMTEAQYVDYWQTYKNQGFRPHKQFVCPSTNGGGTPRYACIWRPQQGEGWVSYHRMTGAEFNQKVQDLAQQSYRLTDFQVYRMGSSLRVSGIWVKKWKPYYCWWGLTAAQFQAKFNEHANQGFALTHFVPYEEGASLRYGGIWTKGVFPSFYFYFGLSASGYQQKYEELAGKGFRLVEVRGYNDSKSFAGLWAKGVTGEPQLD